LLFSSTYNMLYNITFFCTFEEINEFFLIHSILSLINNSIKLVYITISRRAEILFVCYCLSVISEKKLLFFFVLYLIYPCTNDLDKFSFKMAGFFYAIPVRHGFSLGSRAPKLKICPVFFINFMTAL
jgi:hypothetical protein